MIIIKRSDSPLLVVAGPRQQKYFGVKAGAKDGGERRGLLVYALFCWLSDSNECYLEFVAG